MTTTGKIGNDVVDFLNDADLRIATLESALGTGETKCHIKMGDPQLGNIIFSPDECAINILKRMKIDAVSLANNHVCDLDLAGLQHTIELLDLHGIKHFGAGRNKEEAEKPVIINKNGKKICLLGYFPPMWEAPYPPTETIGGLNHFYIDKVIKDVQEYSKKCDYLFVMPHWGKEYSRLPFLSDVIYAKRIIQAGATGIIGSHTHIVQPIIHYGNGLIATSLGNFLFPDRYIIPPRQTYYPQQQELQGKQIPVTNEYPIVDGLTYKIVNSVGRTGVVCTLLLDGDRLNFSRQYVRLMKDNTLSLADENIKVKLLLQFYGFIIQYELLMRIYGKISNKLRRFKQKL